MKALVVGSGGREHALVRALARSPKIKKIFAAPGNPGMTQAQCIPVRADDIPGLVKLAKDQQVDLTVVGPEVPLVAGIVDQFEAVGLKIFGPNKKAAILEASKAFTKEFLAKYQIPTAKYRVFKDGTAAKKFVGENSKIPWVVKVDGLAAGKGVFVSKTPQETLQALDEVFQKKSFGEQSVVLEEFLDGEEVSFMVLSDGERAFPLPSAQDHKRLLDGDQGPNTGGMGAYSPAPIVTPELHEKIMTRVIGPTLRGMVAEGRPFKGILYAGLMIVSGEPLVLEYNVRFGDPEAQVILPRLRSDWVDLLEATLAGRLDRVSAVWKEESAVVVVLAAEGYPNSPRKGDLIEGLEEAAKESYVYHAGTSLQNGNFLTSGGRVLGITALGKNLKSAVEKAYQAVEKIHFKGMHYRKDIAKKGMRARF
jgi:phosphoribosylamine---glycine ligase